MDNLADDQAGRRKRYVPPRTLIQFHLRAQEVEALRQLARSRDVPVTHILREAVGRTLAEANL